MTYRAYRAFRAPSRSPAASGTWNWHFSQCILRNHSIRWGVDLRNQIMNKYQAGGDTRGTMNFAAGMTSTTGAGTGDPNSVASFLLGLPGSISRTAVEQLGGFRQRSYYFFLQDRWQVGSKLTLNYGLRYEIMPFATAANPGDQSSYNPNTNQVMMAGYGSINKQLNVNTDYKDFGPRLGAAYRAFSKTVVRAGYGISFNPLPVNQLSAANYPSQLNLQISGPNSYQPAGSLAAGFSIVPLVSVSSGIVSAPGNLAMAIFNVSGRRGYVQSLNFTIEQEIAGWVISNSYVASLGTRMLGSYNVNAAPPGSTQADLPLNKLYGRTAATTYYDYMLSSDYHAYQLSAKRTMRKFGIVTVAYAYSKSLDYADNWALNYDLNVDVNRGYSSVDQPHNLTVSHVTNLPFGKGQRYLQQGIASQVLGGWRIGGIFAARTGTPINITGVKVAADNSVGTTNRPNVLSTPAILKGVGPGLTWFDTSVFAEPAAHTLGDVGRNTVFGPGYLNYSASLSRIFPIKERMRLMINAAAFNLTNSSHYSNPSGTFSSGSFGRITASYNERQVRLGARIEF